MKRSDPQRAVTVFGNSEDHVLLHVEGRAGSAAPGDHLIRLAIIATQAFIRADPNDAPRSGIFPETDDVIAAETGRTVGLAAIVNKGILSSVIPLEAAVGSSQP